MSGKSRIIKQDGLEYTFTPGRHGSLRAPAPAPKPLFTESVKRSRYVGDALDKVAKKRKYKKKITDVGAVRG